MGAIFTAVCQWLAPYFYSLVASAIFYMFSDTILGWLHQLVDLLVGGVRNAGVNLPSVSTSMAALPAGMKSIMKRIGLDSAFAVIVGAIALRSAASAFNFIRQLRRGNSTP